MTVRMVLALTDLVGSVAALVLVIVSIVLTAPALVPVAALVWLLAAVAGSFALGDDGAAPTGWER